MSVVIGLTGGISTGKSTVSSMLRELGAVIIDADRIAREVVEPGEQTLERIAERFGDDVINANGRLDREKMGEIVFGNVQARQDLNRIIHPAIRKRMLAKKEKALQAGVEWVVMDIPLLFESKLEHYVDKILVVYVPEHVQRERLMKRDGIDAVLAQQKMDSQMHIETKKDKGDAYIDNSGSLEETRHQLIHVLKKWKEQQA
jgi:dephospho-CoA kinase